LDGDELLALLISLAIAVVGAVRWYASLFRVTSFASPARHRLALGVFPLLCIALIHEVLACCAAREVRQDATYQWLFLIGEAAWLALAAIGLLASDIHPRDDAIETRNPAAVVAMCGTWLGATLCYAGGNIGEGPTIWTTFAPAAAATLVLFLSLLFLQLSTGVAVLLQQLLRPSPQRPEGRTGMEGLLPALAMILAAAADWWVLGLPEHCQRGG
jgi:hypothetical protein